jgi:recombination protein RecT
VQLREALEVRRPEWKAGLPPDINPDAFIRAVITSATINPEILACSKQSIILSCHKACRDGLLPDGVEAALVPYKSTATYVPMYQGLLRNFRRSGQFKSLSCNVVRDGEEFDHYIDEHGEHIMHRPGGDDTAPVVRVYAVATLKDGGVVVADIGMGELQKIRNMSRNSRDDAPWKIWPDEMRKKTALRRLSKLLPTVRDIMKSDLDEHEAPDIAPRDEIAAIPAAPVTDTKSEVAGDEGGGGTAAAPQPSQPAAATSVCEAAYRRGQEAKLAGQERKSIPGEYRSRDRLEEGRAWQDGFDGKPLDDKGEAQLV